MPASRASKTMLKKIAFLFSNCQKVFFPTPLSPMGNFFQISENKFTVSNAFAQKPLYSPQRKQTRNNAWQTQIRLFILRASARGRKYPTLELKIPDKPKMQRIRWMRYGFNTVSIRSNTIRLYVEWPFYLHPTLAPYNLQARLHAQLTNWHLRNLQSYLGNLLPRLPA